MSYAQRVLEQLKVRYAHEPEYIQAATEILPTLKPVIDRNEEKYRREALLERITLEPHPIAGTITLKAEILPLKNGTFQLHAQLCPAKAPACAEEAPPVRAMTLHLIAHQAQTVEITLEARCPRFVPGEAYDAPGLKIQLFEKPVSGQPRSSVLCGSSVLCDSAVLLCGYPAAAPASMLPLRAEDCRCADAQGLPVVIQSRPPLKSRKKREKSEKSR